VIFYGRNDNHGYNLHKRASLSLNNMAELLSDKDDEILFVDWNTSPGLPTFIESIHDLLTDKAKDLIKTIKVDFEIHERLFGAKTSKQTVEPVARNVAIIRSNPKNKWILSTNTDMIFIPKNSIKSLSDICSKLADGFYELPRFSIPEILWETFDRLDPKGVMQGIKELRLKIDLDEIITAGPILRFDAPGDFQLCLRSQLFEINGFDENMILGWHVDSNLCRRLNILNGETKSLENELYGYHC
jgi:GT2 family glycosyltransferase